MLDLIKSTGIRFCIRTKSYIQSGSVDRSIRHHTVTRRCEAVQVLTIGLSLAEKFERVSSSDGVREGYVQSPYFPFTPASSGDVHKFLLENRGGFVQLAITDWYLPPESFIQVRSPPPSVNPPPSFTRLLPPLYLLLPPSPPNSPPPPSLCCSYRL